ncbi:MAG: ABC transporter substrate-binding protein [Clostridia bacterium]|nr:ABC transporter substrate-binding protein [Clostridia bacterium]
MIKKRKVFWVTALLTGFIMMASGCGSQSQGEKITHIKIGNGGATCEAPLYAAIEKGFFKEEGLQAETEFLDFDKTKVGIAADKVDGVMGNLEWIKPIEQGFNIKYTLGIHKGCIQAVAPNGSGIKSVKDLKGKKIGVNAMGDFPMVLMSTALKNAGLDPKKDVDFRVYPGPNLEQALDKKEIDAFIMWDPFGQLYIDSGKGYSFFSDTRTPPYSEQYCCLLVLRGKLVDENPETAAKITRAIIKGAKWVSENPEEAARIIVEKKYISGEVASNAALLKQYNFEASVEGGRKSLEEVVRALKEQEILEKDTDMEALVKKAYVAVTENHKN